MTIPFGLGMGSGAGREMKGRQVQDQTKLLYEFCLEDRVSADQLLWKIDRLLISASRAMD